MQGLRVQLKAGDKQNNMMSKSHGKLPFLPYKQGVNIFDQEDPSTTAFT